MHRRLAAKARRRDIRCHQKSPKLSHHGRFCRFGWTFNFWFQISPQKMILAVKMPPCAES
jgi:hypothetical protein